MHQLGTWGSIGAVVAGKGSKDTLVDIITTGDYPPPFSDGTFKWTIPWEYRVASGSPKEFTTVDHDETVDPTGKTTISKGGTTKFREASDPDSSY